MPICHQWIKYNVSFPALPVVQGDAIFPVDDTQYGFVDFGSNIFTGASAQTYPTITIGLRFSGGNAGNINIWLDGLDADLYPRVGSGNSSLPLFKERIFSESDNTSHFQLKYLELDENSSSAYTTFNTAADASTSGGSIVPVTSSTAIGIGTVRIYQWADDIHRDYIYSQPIAFRLFAPTNTSPYPYTNWEIRNFRLRLKYESVE